MKVVLNDHPKTFRCTKLSFSISRPITVTYLLESELNLPSIGRSSASTAHITRSKSSLNTSAPSVSIHQHWFLPQYSHCKLLPWVLWNLFSVPKGELIKRSINRTLATCHKLYYVKTNHVNRPTKLVVFRVSFMLHQTWTVFRMPFTELQIEPKESHNCIVNIPKPCAKMHGCSFAFRMS